MTLTTDVVASFANAEPARTRELLAKLIAHLHAFVRDAEPSFDEWRFAIDFLTRTGQMSDATRQEFILLSDVLGVSMLVDAIGHPDRAGATETTVLGPFYVGEHRLTAHGTDIAGDVPGERLIVEATIETAAGAPVANATIDVWHADGDGLYDSQRPGYRADHPAMRARFVSDAAGHFGFRTIVPCSYPVPTDGPVGELLRAGKRHAMRPAHIHFLIAAPGFPALVTHLFVAGDDYLASDVVYGVKPELIVPLAAHADGKQLSYAFVIA